jgi:hypothetical protein
VRTVLARWRLRLHGWLFGCRAVLVDEDGEWFCTLDHGHSGRHEAWACLCAGGGRCEDAAAVCASWA